MRGKKLRNNIQGTHTRKVKKKKQYVLARFLLKVGLPKGKTSKNFEFWSFWKLFQR